MRTILVTGFGPFRDHSVNASWEAVKLLPNEIDDIKLVKVEIPVTYEDVDRKIPALWKDCNPELVVHVGVSSYTSDLKLERIAHRAGYVQADCTGNLRCTQSVCCSGEDCIMTGINIEKICEEVNTVGPVKASPSENAGRYLCEFIYYMSLNIDRERVLFVHVPPLDKPYSAKELSDGLLNIISSILEDKHAEISNNVVAVKL